MLDRQTKVLFGQARDTYTSYNASIVFISNCTVNLITAAEDVFISDCTANSTAAEDVFISDCTVDLTAMISYFPGNELADKCVMETAKKC